MADITEDNSSSTSIETTDYNDIYLGVLSVNGESIKLSKKKVIYTCSVESDTTEVTIRAIPEYIDTTTVTINDTILSENNSYKMTVSLSAGRNIFSIKVYDSNSNERYYNLYIVVGSSNTSSSSSSSKTKSRALSTIETSSQIALYPVGSSYESDDALVLPISPSDLMFSEDSDPQTIKLINYGELPVGMNRKLATWSVDSFFPHRTTLANNSSKNFKYWFDVSKGTEDPYTYYCKALMDWKNNQTPLVFFFETWNGYYNCQIKKFTYGRKDAIGNVYYQLEFQEYKEYTRYNTSSASTDYSSDTYYPAEGENILQICKKLYGSSDYYQYFMNLNNMTTTDIVAGQAYKVR